MKKILSVLLTITLVCSATAVAATAANTDGWRENPDVLKNMYLYGDYEAIIPGDTTADLGYKEPDIFDVTTIQQHIAKMNTLDEKVMKSADFDGDGEVSIFDATNIQRYIAQMDYDCVIRGDDSYLKAQAYSNTTLEEYASEKPNVGEVIRFERLCASRYLGDRVRFVQADTAAPYGGFETALITSREQLFAMLGCYFEAFDDDFFRDNALVVMLDEPVGGSAMEYHDIFALGVDDGKLRIYFSRLWTYLDQFVMPPSARWCNIIRVDKSAVQDVQELEPVIFSAYYPKAGQRSFANVDWDEYFYRNGE